jgi:hypothetical protein
MAGIIRIGIIAERGAIGDEEAEVLVGQFMEIVDREKSHDNRIVVASTASVGMSQLVIEKAAEWGMRYEIIVPYAGYAEEFEEGDERQHYRKLIGRALDVHLMPFGEPISEAYEGANRWMVKNCDLVVGVWDGQTENIVSLALHDAELAGVRRATIFPTGFHMAPKWDTLTIST